MHHNNQSPKMYETHIWRTCMKRAFHVKCTFWRSVSDTKKMFHWTHLEARVRESRFTLATADPPPPHSLCITGLAAHNRWLSLFSSARSSAITTERGREREGKRGQEAEGWCWISQPTASGLARPGADGQAGGGGRWMVGAANRRVCPSTLQSYRPCTQLWQSWQIWVTQVARSPIVSESCCCNLPVSEKSGIMLRGWHHYPTQTNPFIRDIQLKTTY